MESGESCAKHRSRTSPARTSCPRCDDGGVAMLLVWCGSGNNRVLSRRHHVGIIHIYKYTHFYNNSLSCALSATATSTPTNRQTDGTEDQLPDSAVRCGHTGHTQQVRGGHISTPQQCVETVWKAESFSVVGRCAALCNMTLVGFVT